MSRTRQLARLAVIALAIICGLNGDLGGRVVATKTISVIVKIG